MIVSNKVIFQQLELILDSSIIIYYIYRSLNIGENYVKLQIWDTAGQ
jgi:hypothetical protein